MTVFFLAAFGALFFLAWLLACRERDRYVDRWLDLGDVAAATATQNVELIQENATLGEENATLRLEVVALQRIADGLMDAADAFETWKFVDHGEAKQ